MPGSVQLVDPKDAGHTGTGGNKVVATVASVRAAGHNVPDFSQLPQGKYTYAEAVKKLKESPGTGLPMEDTKNAAGAEVRTQPQSGVHLQHDEETGEWHVVNGKDEVVSSHATMDEAAKAAAPEEGKEPEPEPFLEPADQKAFDYEIKKVKTPIRYTDPTDESNPFHHDTVATIDRKTGQVVINKRLLKWHLDNIPRSQRHQAIKSVLDEEVTHLHTKDSHALAYWKTLHPWEQAIVKRIYSGGREVGGMNDTLWGHEALRMQRQRLTRMKLSEVASAAGREKWTLAGLQVIEASIRSTRRILGRRISRIQDAILKHTQRNIDEAKAVLSGRSPSALFRGRPKKQAESKEQQEFILPDVESQRVPGTTEAVSTKFGEEGRELAKVPQEERSATEEAVAKHVPKPPTGVEIDRTANDELAKEVNERLEVAKTGQNTRLPNLKDFSKRMRSHWGFKPGHLADLWSGAVGKFISNASGEDLRLLGKAAFGGNVREILSGKDLGEKSAQTQDKALAREASKKGGSIWNAPVVDKDFGTEAAERVNLAHAQDKYPGVGIDALDLHWADQRAQAEFERRNKLFNEGKIEAAPSLEKLKVAELQEVAEGKRIASKKYQLERSLAKSRELKSIQSAKRRRAWISSAIFRKMVKPDVADSEGILNRKSVTPDDVRPSNDGKYSSYEDVSDFPQSRVAEALSDKARRSSSDSATVTRRLAVLENKRTGEVSLVSAYDRPHGPDVANDAYVIDPLSATRTHIPLEDAMGRYRVLRSVFLDQPVRKFKQDFKDLDEFNDKFGDQVERDVKNAGSYAPDAISPAEFAQEAGGRISEGSGGSFQGPHRDLVAEPEHGAAEVAERTPLTGSELRAVSDLLEAGGSPRNAADVKRVLQEMTEKKPSPLVVSALRKVAADVQKAHPDWDADAMLNALAHDIYEKSIQSARTLQEGGKQAPAGSGKNVGTSAQAAGEQAGDQAESAVRSTTRPEDVISSAAARNRDFKTGEPVTVQAYHGSRNAVFSKFSMGKFTWFTSDPEYASGRAEESEIYQGPEGKPIEGPARSPAVYPVTVTMKNPLVTNERYPFSDIKSGGHDGAVIGKPGEPKFYIPLPEKGAEVKSQIGGESMVRSPSPSENIKSPRALFRPKREERDWEFPIKNGRQYFPDLPDYISKKDWQAVSKAVRDWNKSMGGGPIDDASVAIRLLNMAIDDRETWGHGNFQLRSGGLVGRDYPLDKETVQRYFNKMEGTPYGRKALIDTELQESIEGGDPDRAALFEKLKKELYPEDFTVVPDHRQEEFNFGKSPRALFRRQLNDKRDETMENLGVVKSQVRNLFKRLPTGKHMAATLDGAHTIGNNMGAQAEMSIRLESADNEKNALGFAKNFRGKKEILEAAPAVLASGAVKTLYHYDAKALAEKARLFREDEHFVKHAHHLKSMLGRFSTDEIKAAQQWMGKQAQNRLIETGFLNHDNARYLFDTSAKPMLDKFMADVKLGTEQAKTMAARGNVWDKYRGRRWIKSNEKIMRTLEYAKAQWEHPELRNTAVRAKMEADRQFDTERDNGYSLHYDPEYLPGRYEGSVWSPNGIIFGGQKIMGRQYYAGKTFKNIYEAAKVGPYIPASLDIASLMGSRVRTGMNSVSQRMWWNSLKELKDENGNFVVKEGKPGGGAPSQDYVEFPLKGTMQKVYVHQSYEGLIHQLTDPDATMHNAASKLLLETTQYLKHTALLGDVFHLGRVMYYSQSIMGFKGAKFIPGWAATVIREGDLDRAVDRGIIAPQTRDYLKEKIAFRIGPKADIISRSRLSELYERSGLNTGRIQDALYKDLVKNFPILGTYNRFLFDRFTTGMMKTGALREFDRLSKLDPEKDSRQIVQESAKDLNLYFGSIGRQGWIKSATFRSIANMGILAPQWLEGLVKKELQPLKLLTNPHAALTGRTTAFRGIARGLGAMMVLTQVANMITRGTPTWSNPEPDHKWDAWIPGNIWLSPLAVFNELTADIVRISETKQRKWDAVQQVGMNKLSFAGRFAMVLASGSSPTGEYQSTTAGVLKTAAAQLIPIPISVGTWAQFGAHFLAPGTVPPVPLQQLMQKTFATMGIKTHAGLDPVQTMNIAAQAFRQANGVEEPKIEFTDEATNSKLRYQLKNGDEGGAARTLQQLRQHHTDGEIIQSMETWARRPFTSHVQEGMFQAGMDDYGRKVYNQAIQQRYDQVNQFLEWYDKQAGQGR